MGKWGHSSTPTKRRQTGLEDAPAEGEPALLPQSRARVENCRTAIFGGRSSEATGLLVCKNGRAEMHRGGPYCFLLAALHSVAERVNPRKARPPAPHSPRAVSYTHLTLPTSDL